MKIMNRYINELILSGLLATCTIPSVHARNIENAMLASTATYLYLLTVTTGHELGHALTAKLLFKAPIRIQIGTNLTNDTSYPEKGISFGGVIPIGFTYIKEKHLSKVSTMQKLLFYIAGPIGGLMTGYVLNKCLRSHIPFTYKESLSLLADLIPFNFFGFKSDGYRIIEDIYHVLFPTIANEPVKDLDCKQKDVILLENIDKILTKAKGESVKKQSILSYLKDLHTYDY